MQTQGAISFLNSRYRAVLKNCRWKNWLCTLVLAAGLTISAGAVPAQAGLSTDSYNVDIIPGQTDETDETDGAEESTEVGSTEESSGTTDTDTGETGGTEESTEAGSTEESTGSDDTTDTDTGETGGAEESTDTGSTEESTGTDDTTADTGAGATSSDPSWYFSKSTGANWPSDVGIYLSDKNDWENITGSIVIPNRSVVIVDDYQALRAELGDNIAADSITIDLRSLRLVPDVSEDADDPNLPSSSSETFSVLALSTRVNLQQAESFIVGGDTAESGGAAHFYSNSMLVLDGRQLDAAVSDASGLADQEAMLTVKGAVTVDSNSYLVVSDIGASGWYSLVRGSSVTIDPTSWDESMVYSSSALLSIAEATIGVQDGTVYLHALVNQESIGGGIIAGPDATEDAKTNHSRMDSDLVSLVDSAIAAGYTDPNSASYGEQLINKAVNNFSSREQTRRTIEGAARLATLSAVPQQLLTIGAETAKIAQARTSLQGADIVRGGVTAIGADGGKSASGLAGGDVYDDGFAMWVAPVWKHSNGADFAAGNYDAGYATDLGGIMLGMDWTFDSSLRLGVQLNMGGGYTTSTGSFADTENSFNWWGAGLYGGWRCGDFGISADAGITSSYNRMSQDLDSALSMGSELEADTRANSLTAGVTFEYRFETAFADITPHAGARYSVLHVYGYDTEAQGQTVLTSDDIWATVWQFPVGVNFAKTFVTESGWKIAPHVDLTVIPAAGELEAAQDVKFAGLPGSASLDAEIVDAWSGRGTAGVSFETGAGFGFGLDYTFQASRHETSHGIQAMLKYEF
ncbi:MAG: autotransporter outer membrane beta-barrel domain-containing protein [Desulfovibrionaceae bacterium]|nr:autotransporter outer membrane beta-barrel domain-containing protein [Desulfovibrionaceae bacterium]